VGEIGNPAEAQEGDKDMGMDVLNSSWVREDRLACSRICDVEARFEAVRPNTSKDSFV
jgi:ribosomal protein L15E